MLKFFKEYFLFYGSYLVFPFLFFIIYKIFYFKENIFYWIFLFFTIIFIYSRFIEKNIITIKKQKIKVGFKAKIIVISDLHLGIFVKKSFLNRVVNKINKIKNVDFIVIPGDFVYDLENNFEEIFDFFKKIKVPIFAVLGNHDFIVNNFEFKKDLVKALKNNNVILLDEKKIKYKNINILGLNDYSFDKKINYEKINFFLKEKNTIVITHNPDKTLMYKNNYPDLTISGHTHGGQIRIPFIYKKILKLKGKFNNRLYNLNNDKSKLFISSGLGVVRLPLRFGIPPVIDVLNLE